MSRTLLIQFSKSPELGKVKTRLTSVLSEVQRNELHCAMTQWTCEQLSRVDDSNLELWVAGDKDNSFFKQLNQQYDCTLLSQSGQDLGERMAFACQQGLQRYDHVIIVGSDCPFLSTETINQAIDVLENVDIAFVPANDGGYVLLAMKVFEKSLFENIAWGSDSVLETSLNHLKHSNRSYFLLPPLPDIDRPDDLKYLNNSMLPEPLRKFSR